MLFFPFICFAQLPDTVKHVEIASQVADTMILINKPDLDKINTAFYRLDTYEELNRVNEELIADLKIESNNLKEIASKQEIIIENQKIQLVNKDTQYKETISDLEKQVKRANTWTTIWQVLSGIEALGIVFLAVF